MLKMLIIILVKSVLIALPPTYVHIMAKQRSKQNRKDSNFIVIRSKKDLYRYKDRLCNLGVKAGSNIAFRSIYNYVLISNIKIDLNEYCSKYNIGVTNGRSTNNIYNVVEIKRAKIKGEGNIGIHSRDKTHRMYNSISINHTKIQGKKKNYLPRKKYLKKSFKTINRFNKKLQKE